MARNFERQMWTVQNLSRAPRDNCTVTKFEVEEWVTGHVFVSREYRPDHAPSLLYSQGIVVGPRGGTKILYDRGNW